MQISEKHLSEFKEHMRKKVGEEKYSKMTEQELLASAISLVTLMKVIYRPIKKVDYERIQAWEKKQNDEILTRPLIEFRKQNPHLYRRTEIKQKSIGDVHETSALDYNLVWSWIM
jgi:hypothetical protein